MSHFHTLRISNPRFERDSLRFITVKSPALKGRGDLLVFVPPGVTIASPVVTLLHGVYGSCWSWAFGGGAHRTAQTLIERGAIPPMLLAMPSDGLWGDGSGYLPHREKNFETWIVEDVPHALSEALRHSMKAPRFIAGLSMGGFGALRLGARYADRYRGISGHSSITHFDQMSGFVEEELSLYASAEQDHAVADALLAAGGSLPPLRFDCGLEDPLLSANRELHHTLREAGVPHQYQEFPGDHAWPYWEEHFAKTLRFFAGILASAPKD